MNTRLFASLTGVFVLASIFPVLYLYFVVYLYLLDGALMYAAGRLFFGKNGQAYDHPVFVNIIVNIIPLIICYLIYFDARRKSVKILVGIFMMIFTFCFLTFCTNMNEDSDPFYIKPIIISVVSGLFLILTTQFISHRLGTL